MQRKIKTHNERILPSVAFLALFINVSKLRYINSFNGLQCVFPEGNEKPSVLTYSHADGT